MGKSMKSWLAGVAGLAALIAGLPAAMADGPQILAVGSGEVSGMFYPEAGAICRLVNKDLSRHRLRCMVEPTAGSAANLTALRNGDTQLAIVQSKVLAQAVEGNGASTRDADTDLRALMSLHGETLAVLVAPGAKIKTAADLKGKRVSLGRPDSFQRLMADALLSAERLGSKDMAAALEIDTAKVAEAVCRNEVDAAILTGLHPIAEIQDAIDDCGATLLPLKDAALDAFVKANPAFARQTIPQDTYSGASQAVPTFGVASVLVTTAALPADQAYEVVKAVYENLPALKAMHPLLGGLDRKRMAHDALVAPLHEGALRYYRESGLR